MEKMRTTMWQYAPNNSPLPLPQQPFICTDSNLYPLKFNYDTTKQITHDVLKQSLASAEADGVSLAEFLQSKSAPSMSERIPILLLGELANPFQLSRLKLGIIPIINVRLQGLCRTYADGLDSRMISPGIHHITVARTAGWWEKTHLAFATLQQIKKMIQWLNNGRHGEWRPVKPNEGEIRVENEPVLAPPAVDSLSWDGKTETCIGEEPEANGPAFDITQVMVPIYTKLGCYDSRGKIVRCAHVGQREFHSDYFRRGSSKRWQDILHIV